MDTPKANHLPDGTRTPNGTHATGMTNLACVTKGADGIAPSLPGQAAAVESPATQLATTHSPASQVAAPAPTDDGETYYHRRRQKVLECAESALANPDPLLASIGSSNAGLLQIALASEEAILAALAAGPPGLELVAEVQPFIENHLKLVRQSDRLSALAFRELQSRREAERHRPDPIQSLGRMVPPSPGTVGRQWPTPPGVPQ